MFTGFTREETHPDAVVVGDSIDNDVTGAQGAGCLGVAVSTGTFSAARLKEDGVHPDAVLDSLADLPAWLGL